MPEQMELIPASAYNEPVEFIGGMHVKRDVKKIVFEWLDNILSVGREFGPAEVQRHVRIVTSGKRKPQDATITRYIRFYNEEGGHIRNSSRSKSLYIKEKNR